jgi:hypothetical protein
MEITLEDPAVLRLPDRPHPALRRLATDEVALTPESFDARLGFDLAAMS